MFSQSRSNAASARDGALLPRNPSPSQNTPRLVFRNRNEIAAQKSAICASQRNDSGQYGSLIVCPCLVIANNVNDAIHFHLLIYPDNSRSA
jgi:hypothetical protein